MTWDWVTVGLVVSGRAIVILSLLLDSGAALVQQGQGDLFGGRRMFIGLGLPTIAYGLFVATQDSGTWGVPVVLLPVGLVGFLVFEKIRSSG